MEVIIFIVGALCGAYLCVAIKDVLLALDERDIEDER